jgi:hypothetical protein
MISSSSRTCLSTSVTPCGLGSSICRGTRSMTVPTYVRFVGNFQGTYMCLGKQWELRNYKQQPGESLREYIQRFSSSLVQPITTPSRRSRTAQRARPLIH